MSANKSCHMKLLLTFSVYLMDLQYILHVAFGPAVRGFVNTTRFPN